MEGLKYIADLVRMGAGIQQVGSQKFLVAPPGYTAKDVTTPAVPERVITTRQFHDGNSLAAYAKSYDASRSLLLADSSTSTITIILDYHGHAETWTDGNVGACDHKAVWRMQHSQEYEAWASFEGKLHPQEEFIRFLEENVMDVYFPDPARLLDLARDFEAIKTVNFKSSKRLQSGDREFTYAETTGTTDRISVPEKLHLKFPLYYGEEEQDVTALFRYRMNEGGLKLGYQFHRLKPVMDGAFRAAAVRVAEAAGLPLLLGAAS
ncbi:DUF2303 family protein [Acidiphilium sp.]|uniref:DUF2303 family protein n=1 Tax=Acidiphilium sp. TaxID=527 RepID=UPI00258E9873|nr:DUF2303 family protein [Acidiphilium sp.]